MRMQEAQRQPSCENQGRKVSQFAQPGFPVTPAEMKVKAGAVELADHDESIESGIDEEQLPQACKAIRPRPLEPAQVHGQADCQENDGVSPIAALLGVGDCGLAQ